MAKHNFKTTKNIFNLAVCESAIGYSDSHYGISIFLAEFLIGYSGEWSNTEQEFVENVLMFADNLSELSDAKFELDGEEVSLSDYELSFVQQLIEWSFEENKSDLAELARQDWKDEHYGEVIHG